MAAIHAKGGKVMFNLAIKKMMKYLLQTYRGGWYGLTFDKKDDNGFWFVYRLEKDNKRYRHCIKFDEL